MTYGGLRLIDLYCRTGHEYCHLAVHQPGLVSIVNTAHQSDECQKKGHRVAARIAAVTVGQGGRIDTSTGS